MTEPSELSKRLLKAANDAWTLACEDESLGSNAAMTMVVDAIVNAMPDPLAMAKAMQERCAAVADEIGGVRARNIENDRFRAQHVRAASIAKAIRMIDPATMEQSNAKS